MKENPKARELALKRKAEQEELTKSFQELFASKNGKFVLSELSRMCKENEATYVDQNPHGTCYREGQRSIILGIRSQLNKTFTKPVQESAEL